VRWPFRRPRPAPTATGPTSRSEPAAWRSLPTIQRAVLPIEPSAHSGEFVLDLGTRRPLEHFLAPLGHEVRTEAPSGIATGIADPAVARSGGPELEFSHPMDRQQEPVIESAVARWPAATQRASEQESGREEESAPVGRMPVVEPVRTLQPVQGAPAPVAAGEAEPEILPEPTAPAEVARAEEVEPAPASSGSGTETEAIGEDAPAGEVQRAPEPEAPLVGKRFGIGEPLTSRPPTAREAPRTGAESLPLSARGKTEGGERAKPAGIRAADAGALTPGVQRTADIPGSEGAAEVVAPLTGETTPLAGKQAVLRTWSTRSGEADAPSEPTLEMPVSRASTPFPAGSDLPTPRRLAALPPEAPAFAEGAGGGRPETTQRAPDQIPLLAPPGSPQHAAEGDAPGPSEPPSRRPAGEPDEDIVPDPSGAFVSEAVFPPSPAQVLGPATPLPPVAPLVSARPIGRVQRASEAPPESVRRVVERHTSVDLQEVKAHRDASSATAARQISARAFTTGGEVHVPADHGSLESGEGRALVAHELVHAAQQGRFGPSLPSEASSEGQGLESQARSMESAWRAAPELPVVARAAEPDTGPPAPVMDPGAAAVAAGVAQREPDGSVTFHGPSSGAPSPVQRTGETLEASAPAPEPEKEEEDLDQLADKLYEPLSRRLRQDLLNLRERAGRLADV
jgi:hypothetical protein